MSAPQGCVQTSTAVTRAGQRAGKHGRWPGWLVFVVWSAAVEEADVMICSGPMLCSDWRGAIGTKLIYVV